MLQPLKSTRWGWNLKKKIQLVQDVFHQQSPVACAIVGYWCRNVATFVINSITREKPEPSGKRTGFLSHSVTRPMANLTKPLGIALHFYSNRKKSKKSNGLYFMVPNGSVCHFPMKIGVRLPTPELAGGSTRLCKWSKKSGPQSHGNFPGGASKTYRRCSAGDVFTQKFREVGNWYTLIYIDYAFL